MLWEPSTDQLSVAVTDTRSGESFELSVAGSDALLAFVHPYAYASHDSRAPALAA